MSLEKIEVGSFVIGSVFGVPFRHQYIIYTDKNGDQFAARGGPTGGLSSYDDNIVIGQLSQFDLGLVNIPSVYGTVSTTYGEYNATFFDHPDHSRFDAARNTIDRQFATEIVTTGGDLSNEWNRIKQAMDDINGAGFEYRPLNNNSNGAVNFALSAAGLGGIELQDDYGEAYFSPGHDSGLSKSFAQVLQDFSNEVGDWLFEAIANYAAHLIEQFSVEFAKQYADDLAALAALFDPLPIDPLVIDLDGDGVELMSLEASDVMFDLNIDGFRERTGWVKPDDGLLVRADSETGKVEDGAQLFGDQTGHANGFEALAALDENGDGVFDAQDAAYGELGVWRDLNSDGRVDVGEVQSLEDAGVVSINLNYTDVANDIEGNTEAQTSTVTMANGQVNTASDIFFDRNTMTSEYRMPDGYEFDPVAVLLPYLHNYADIPPSWVAFTDNPELKQSAIDMLDMIANGQFGESRLAFNEFLYQWAGNHVSSAQVEGQWIVNTQKLGFLEKAYGSEFQELVTESNGPSLNALFDQMADKLFGRFLKQAASSSFMVAAQEAFEAGETTISQETLDTFSAHPLAFLANLPDQPSGEDVIKVLEGLQALLDDGTMSLGSISIDVNPDSLGAYQLYHVTVSGNNSSVATPDVTEYPEDFSQTSDEISLWHQQLADAAANTIDDRLVYGTYLETYQSVSSMEIVNPPAMLLHSILSGNFDVGDIVSAQGGDLSAYTLAPYLPGAESLGDEPIEIAKAWLSGRTYRMVPQFEFVPTPAFEPNGREFSGYKRELISSFSTVLDHYSLSPEPDKLYKIVMGTETSEVIDGAVEGEVIAGLEGNDTLKGGYGSDTYVYQDGHGSDTIVETDRPANTARDVLYFEGYSSGDVTFSQAADGDLVFRLNDGETVTVRDHFDFATNEIEAVQFSDGTVLDTYDINSISVQTQIENGSHKIYGSNYADDFSMQAGDQSWFGRNGSDTYIYSLGDGSDTIYDLGRYSNSDIDRVEFTDIVASDVKFSRDAQGNLNLLLSTGETVTVSEFFNHERLEIEFITFSDGVSLSANDIKQRIIIDQTTHDADETLGTRHNDEFFGSTGDDTLVGYGGSDTYVYNLGDGNDTISDWGGYSNLDIDTLHFADLTFDQVSISRNAPTAFASHLMFTMQDSSTINILEHFSNSGMGIERVVFSDGVTFDLSVGADATNSADVLTGADAPNVGDVLLGFSGADTISGQSGDDILVGGADDDDLTGGAGNDTFSFTSGDGMDVITDFAPGRDVIKVDGVDISALSDLPDGISASIDRESNDIVISYGGGDRITLRYQDGFETSFAALYNENVVGTSNSELLETGVGADTLHGNGGNDTLDAGAGDDHLYGGRGYDVIQAGAGDDVIYQAIQWAKDTIDGGDGFDVVDYSQLGDPTGYGSQWTGVDADLATGRVRKFGYYYDGIPDLLTNVERLVGTTIQDKLRGSAAADFLDGNAGNDTIWGRDGADTLHGGSGDDVIYVGVSNGSWSTGDRAFGQDGNDNLIGSNGSAYLDGGDGNDTLNGGDDWVTAESDTLIGGLGDDLLVSGQVHGPTQGTASNGDLLDGGAGADTLQGGQANDTLIGGDGDDHLYGGGGVDVIQAGAGDDVIYQAIQWAKDTIDGGDGFDVVDYSQLGDPTGYGSQWTGVDADLATGRVRKFGYYYDGIPDLLTNVEGLVGTTIQDKLRGSAAADFLDGNAGNDTIWGRDGADTLHGGSGDDFLYGGADADTFVFKEGFGHDVIADYSSNDTIKVSGHTAGDVQVTEQNGSSILTFNSGESSLTLTGYIWDEADTFVWV